jgi:hypothetical protein
MSWSSIRRLRIWIILIQTVSEEDNPITNDQGIRPKYGCPVIISAVQRAGGPLSLQDYTFVYARRWIGSNGDFLIDKKAQQPLGKKTSIS